jgi:competence protein ComFA
MAGRAGRSQQDPNGFVYFCAADWTSSQKEAVQHIRDMNRRASKAGAHA